jgi:hypothetical protein
MRITTICIAPSFDLLPTGGPLADKWNNVMGSYI